jgi:hypothetical protein
MRMRRKVRPGQPDPLCHLWDWGTYAETPRLKDLISGKETPTHVEIITLWQMYNDGAETVGSKPDVVDFGMWLSGVYVVEESIMEQKPCDVSW